MVNMANLPQRQREVLHYIVRHIEDKQESPMQGEIADALGISPALVSQCLDALEEKGKISRIKHKHRSIEVLK